jgi:hypothetical protein
MLAINIKEAFKSKTVIETRIITPHNHILLYAYFGAYSKKINTVINVSSPGKFSPVNRWQEDL